MQQIFQLPNPLDKTSYSHIPSTHGVYIFKKNNTYLYIGKSVNLKARILTHVDSAAQIEKEHAILSQSDTLQIILTDSEFKSLILESQLIQKHHPKYNVIWRDNRSYLYIKISKETYPKIYPVRRENDHKSMYFGPFSSHKEVVTLLGIIRSIIPYCSQKKMGTSACFYHKIELCNPCPNDIERIVAKADKIKLVHTYKGNIKKIILILAGKTNIIQKRFQQELHDLVLQEQYESGILIRNKLNALERLIQFRSFEQYTDSDFNNLKKGIEQLLLRLKPYFTELEKLERIECFDISNLSQKHATASMVVLQHGMIDKSQYRKFRIKNTKLRSDFDMLEEVIRRRFNNNWTLPNLIIIDGGKPQVRKIMKVMQDIGSLIPIIGIAKHPDRLVIGIDAIVTLKLSTNDYGLRLVQQIRDESHRFARKYHLFLREGSML